MININDLADSGLIITGVTALSVLAVYGAYVYNSTRKGFSSELRKKEDRYHLAAKNSSRNIDYE